MSLYTSLTVFFRSGDSEVVVPLWVLEELDKLKTFSDEKGRSARQAIRFLDEVSKHGDLNKGAKVGDGIILKVSLIDPKHGPLDLNREKVDNKIILTALTLKEKGRRVFFVSKDINARVKSDRTGAQGRGLRETEGQYPGALFRLA